MGSSGGPPGNQLDGHGYTTSSAVHPVYNDDKQQNKFNP